MCTEREALRHQLTFLQDQFTQREGELEDALAICAQLQEEASTAAATPAVEKTRESALSAVTRKLQQREAVMSTLRDELEDVNSKMSHVMGEHKRLADTCAERDAMVRHLEQRLQEVAEQRLQEAVDAEMGSGASRNSGLLLEVQLLTEKLRQRQAELHQSQSKLRNNAIVVTTLRDNYARSQQRLEASEAKRDEVVRQNAVLLARLDQLRHKADDEFY